MNTVFAYISSIYYNTSMEPIVKENCLEHECRVALWNSLCVGDFQPFVTSVQKWCEQINSNNIIEALKTKNIITTRQVYDFFDKKNVTLKTLTKVVQGIKLCKKEAQNGKQ